MCIAGLPSPYTLENERSFQHMPIYTPYTYLIGWSHLDKWYYGVRYAKGCHPDDFWTKYFTSSKSVQTLRESEGDPDVIQIRHTFDCPDKARMWENGVIQKMKLHQNNRFLNQCAYPAMSHEAMAKRTPWCKGKTGVWFHSEETKKKMSLNRLGKPNTGVSKSLIGNTRTKGRKWYNDGENEGLFFSNNTPKGWSRGRILNMKGKNRLPKTESAKRKMSEAAKNRSKWKVCCICCQKELPNNSLYSHLRFCNQS